MNNQFSENLKKIRKEYNLSQEQLADELGVSRQAISKWESAIAYPEMDKIISLCDKFNLNIDDLLHKDIKEVKGEEESKRKVNGAIEDFLKFITDTINLFSNMNFKSKVKCLFEQVIIGFILFIISAIIVGGINSLLLELLGFMPNNVKYYIDDVSVVILIIFCVISSVIILTHVFKTRYLNYYIKLKNEISDEVSNTKDNIVVNDSKQEVINKENKVLFKKNENKIIIRDPKHSEYKFINGLFKLIIGIVKFFMLFVALFIGFALICLIGGFIISFLVYKTGVFFIGLLATFMSASVIVILLLLLILNFVFNRKNDKKKIIWSFISSLILFGVGGGLIFIGSLDFTVVDNSSEMLKTVVREHDMNNDLLFYPHSSADIKYVESDINNVKVEYVINNYFEVEERIFNDENSILAYSNCSDEIQVLKDIIKNINNKKIVEIDSSIRSMTIYASKDNIEVIKNNWNKHIENVNAYDEMVSYYEKRVDELESELENLYNKINEEY